MAAFFQSFRSSTMPKRLLRYALSSLELLEEETLDIDNLDLAFGRTTTLEFKDVGVRLKKLERLLQLPPSLKLQKAKVLRLYVTIPMDFYTSPIVVEVDGVDIRLKLLGADDNIRGKEKQYTRSSGGHHVLPHTADLAASFLETQNPADKKKLEDALAAETQDMGASVAMSDSSTSEDDDTNIGTGQPLSLPAFLADFLQGIMDRLQVRIRGVAFQFDVHVPLEANSTSTDQVTFQVELDRIDVEGVTAEMRDEEGEPIIQPKEGKRHIALSQIRTYLISEANVFSSFGRSPTVSSPAMSRESTFTERAPSPASRPEPSPPDQPSLYQSTALDESVELNDIDEALLHDSEDALQIPYDLGEEEGPAPEEENTNTPRASVYLESPVTHSDILPPADLLSSSNSADSDEHVLPWIGEGSLPPSSVTGELLAPSTGPVDSEHLQESGSSGSGSVSPEYREGEDLTQSRVFSHHEAESMYMSAFSHAGSQQLPSQMPGAWDDSASQEPSLSKPDASMARPLNSSTGVPEGLKPDARPSPTADDEQPAPGRQPDQSAVPVEAVDESLEAGTSPNAAEIEPEGDHAVPSQEDVATPRGPTRLVKEIMSLDRISVYVPSKRQHLQVQAASPPSASHASGDTHKLAKSISPQVPGAFSVYSTTAGLEASNAPQSPPTNPAHTETDQSLEVNLTPLDVRFDASLAFLLATVVGKLMDALKSGSEPKQKTSVETHEKQQEQQQGEKSSSPTVKVAVEKVSILFLNQLGGVADTAERVLGSAGMHMQPDILLQTVVDNLSISIDRSSSNVETAIDLEKFRFGYAKDDIISFDQSLQMRTSVMDKFPSPGSDVSLKVIQSPKSIRSEITTLPLLVQLDLHRLDETFSWFGGLSSFLNMSSSVTSSTSASFRTPTPTPTHRKPRGVRFDTPINPDDKSAASQNKVDVRLGGFNVELKGKDCSVGLETSAVKMVSREAGVGFAISKARLAGPFMRNSGAEPSITADVGGLRFDYLNSPNDKDLERLLELITPSKNKFDDGDDEIMVDTLLRQRRKGPLLRLNVDQLHVKVGNMPQLACLPGLGEELARLGTVAKYLPEDDRPGLLTLGKVLEAQATLDFGGKIGVINGDIGDFELTHITVPSLVAFGVGSVSVNRNQREDLVSSHDISKLGATSQGPVLMARMIGDEIEPIIKVKMREITVDYRVPTVMDVLGLGADATPQEFEASLAASVANLGDQAHTALSNNPSPSRLGGSDLPKTSSKPMKVDVLFRNCLVGLNPLNRTSKLMIGLSDAHLQVVFPKDVDTQATLEISKADVLLTDDVSKPTDKTASTSRRQRPVSSPRVSELLSRGFVSICYIASAKAVLEVAVSPEDGEKQVVIDIRDDLLVLETCADSTQTLISLANALTPPTPPSKENKYRTNVVPMQDLLASISPEAFGRAEGEYDFDQDFPMAQAAEAATGSDDEFDLTITGSGSLPDIPPHEQENPVAEQLFSAGGSMMSGVSMREDGKDAGPRFGTGSSETSDDSGDLTIDENYFTQKQDLDSRARVWNSARNTYDRAPADWVQRSPLRVSVRDVHFIWHLFDGYDWDRTRDEITKTAEEVENKALERRRRSEPSAFEENEDEDVAVIGDYLFNSIYIGIPANRDPRDLTQMINEDVNDNATFTETESTATTAVTAAGSRVGGRQRKKKLRLNRSRHHKVTFELSGLNADLVVFPSDAGETQSSIDVRVHNLEIFDLVPTSTWKTFATYDKDFGEREMNTSMIRLELLNVKPHAELAASEIVLRATVLPLRLHVDQDALDFITRFFEFKDDKVPVHSSPSDVPFLQRVEVMDVSVQLDFKPKRVDYGGLKSGKTTEFMNFVILEQARLTLRHVIIYGVSGFDRMGKTLNDIWMPDVKRTQLPGVLAGLAPIRGLVNIGSGFKDLIEIPVKEYQKDGRIFRSLRMGATAFAKTTGTEMVKLGAKVAVGTQTALQGAEGLLVSKPPGHHYGQPSSSSAAEVTTWDGDDPSDADADEQMLQEQQKQISLYADQPTGVVQGLRGGYSSLTRDLHLVRDAIIAVPGEVMESQNAHGLAKVMMRRAPTIVFRPAIGASKAVGKALLGATNSLDPENRRRVDEKYKKH